MDETRRSENTVGLIGPWPAEGPADRAAALVLDDFAEAFEVYERLAAEAVGNADDALQLQRITPDTLAFRPLACSRVVIACGVTANETLGQASPQAAERAAFERKASQAAQSVRTVGKPRAQGVEGILPLLDPATYVYVIAVAAASEAPLGSAFSTYMERRCAALGLFWMGGLFLERADLVTAVRFKPRLGAWRRRVSESVDELIGCVRAQAPSGNLYVAYPVPKPLELVLRITRKSGR